MAIGGGMSGGIGGNAKKTSTDIDQMSSVMLTRDVSGNIQNPHIQNTGKGSVSLVMSDYGSVQASLAMSDQVSKQALSSSTAMGQKALDHMAAASKMAVENINSAATVDANRTKTIQYGITSTVVLIVIIAVLRLFAGRGKKK